MKELQVAQGHGHIRSLDGLRGIATIIVMLFHFFTSRFPYGWMGVDLFFVLSGFLITGILLSTKDSPNYYRNYIAKRTLRIFPLYYFFLILFFIVFKYTGIYKGIGDYEYLSGIQNWYWLYVQNWLVFFDPVYPRQEIISHFWSLAIEEQFYVFWPLVVYITSSKHILKVCISLIFISIFTRLFLTYYMEMSFTKTYVFTFARLDALAVGSALAVMVRNPGQLKMVNKSAIPVLLVSGLIIAITVVVNRSFDFQYFTTYGYSVVAIFFGSLLLLSLSNHTGNIWRRITETKVLAFFGKYSYGLYVYHIPVLRILSHYLKPYISSRAVLLVICIVVSVIVAYLSYHLIEKHFLKLKDKFHVKHQPQAKAEV